MPKFCTQCGTPAANDALKFCSKCGAALPASAPSPAAAQPSAAASTPSAPAVAAPAPAAAPAAAASSSAWVKILLGIVGFFVFVGVLGIATCAYVGYKAKQKVDQFKAENGLNNTGPAAQARDVCSLISKEEVGQATGVAIATATGSESKCDYASATNPVVVENDISWEGGALGLKLGVAALRGMGPVDTIAKVPGIGDEAYTVSLDAKTKADMQKDAEKDQSGMVKGIQHVMGMAPLMFRKGDTMVTVRVTEAGDPDAAKQSIAKLIASRL